MKKMYRIALYIVLLIFLYFVYLNVDVLGYKERNALNQELNKIIKMHDIDEMKRITGGDNYSYNFLVSLPKNTKVTNTSDAQGSDGKLMYFGTEINNYKADVYLSKSQNGLFGPKFRIESLTVYPESK